MAISIIGGPVLMVFVPRHATLLRTRHLSILAPSSGALIRNGDVVSTERERERFSVARERRRAGEFVDSVGPVNQLPSYNAGVIVPNGPPVDGDGLFVRGAEVEDSLVVDRHLVVEEREHT